MSAKKASLPCGNCDGRGTITLNATTGVCRVCDGTGATSEERLAGIRLMAEMVGAWCHGERTRGVYHEDMKLARAAVVDCFNRVVDARAERDEAREELRKAYQDKYQIRHDLAQRTYEIKILRERTAKLEGSLRQIADMGNHAWSVSGFARQALDSFEDGEGGEDV